MATLDQWIGYADRVSDFLKEAQYLKEAIDELGSDPMGVLSIVNLENLLTTTGVVKMKVEKVVPKRATRLPDVDLPTPREDDLPPLSEPEPDDNQEDSVALEAEKLKSSPRGGFRPSDDETASLKMAPPETRKRMLSDMTVNGERVTKQTAKALTYLYTVLADGPKPRVVLIDEAKKKGISEYAVNEARRYASDVKTKIVGVRGMHWIYLTGQEDQLPDANGSAKRVKDEANSDRGLRPDEVSVLMQLPGSVAELIGRTGLAPMKVKETLEFLMRRKMAMLDKGANIWRPTEVAATV